MVKLLLFSKKRIIPLLVALCMTVSFCSVPTVSYAKTWTKSSIKKEISSKQKKYNSIKKKYNKEAKKYKNTIGLLNAEKLSTSPLVCYNNGIAGIGRGYYYIQSGSKNLTVLFTSVTGVVKPTGKTKKWNGYTCTVCKGVKSSSNLTKYKNQMDKLKKQIGSLKSQRNARKEMQESGIGTKSQQALQRQREEMKVERKQITKEMREAEKQKQFDLKQQKKKEKHKGH